MPEVHWSISLNNVLQFRSKEENKTLLKARPLNPTHAGGHARTVTFQHGAIEKQLSASVFQNLLVRDDRP